MRTQNVQGDINNTDEIQHIIRQSNRKKPFNKRVLRLGMFTHC